MKNIFKFLRGKIAKIIVTDNVVNIERQDGQSVIFEANRNNYFIDFNVGILGGDIERNAHGIMVVVDSNPVDFISGENYLINDIEYYSDVKGKAKIDYDDTFFELFLDLSFGDKYSDILLQTDNMKVYVNGELAVRYGYDSIGRLIREDNKAIDKSEIISYDNKGNIIKRREYGFTLKDNTQIEEEKEISVKEYSYAGDEMKTCGGEVCEYDVIGNPNIVK